MTRQTPLLFEWLEVLALALGRKRIRDKPASVALFVALSAKGSTGEGATIDAARLSVELGLSGRQVWRYVEHLADEGWLERTEAPIRGLKGKPGTGRKARYRLTLPALDLSLDTGLHDVTPRSVADVEP